MERRTVEQFKALGYDKLHKELVRMIGQSKRIAVWFDEGERTHLLPALVAMRDLVAQPGRREPDPDKPSWQEECLRLGITPELVRQWKTRTASEQQIRRMLGEEPKVSARGAGREDVVKLKRHLEALAQAVLDGQEEKAEALAQAAADEYAVRRFDSPAPWPSARSRNRKCRFPEMALAALMRAPCDTRRHSSRGPFHLSWEGPVTNEGAARRNPGARNGAPAGIHRLSLLPGAVPAVPAVPTSHN